MNGRTDGRTHCPTAAHLALCSIVQHYVEQPPHIISECNAKYVCCASDRARASVRLLPRQHSLSGSKAESTEQKLQLCDCVRCVCVYFEAARATYDLSVPPIIHCLCSPLCVPFHLSILSLSLCLSVPVPALRARIQFVRRNIRNNKMERYIYLIR